MNAMDFWGSDNFMSSGVIVQRMPIIARCFMTFTTLNAPQPTDSVTFKLGWYHVTDENFNVTFICFVNLGHGYGHTLPDLLWCPKFL